MARRTSIVTWLVPVLALVAGVSACTTSGPTGGCLNPQPLPPCLNPEGASSSGGSASGPRRRSEHRTDFRERCGDQRWQWQLEQRWFFERAGSSSSGSSSSGRLRPVAGVLRAEDWEGPRTPARGRGTLQVPRQTPRLGARRRMHLRETTLFFHPMPTHQTSWTLAAARTLAFSSRPRRRMTPAPMRWARRDRPRVRPNAARENVER